MSGCDSVTRIRERNRVKPIVDFEKRGDISRLEWKAQPKTLQANRRALWSLKVLWKVKPKEGRPYIRDFTFVNEHILHLYVVSQDRKYFAHLLPEPRDYGHFLVETALPRQGEYQLLAEYVPHAALPELKRKTVEVSPSPNGAEVSAPPAPPLLVAGKETKSAAVFTALDSAGNPQLSGDGLEDAAPANYAVLLNAATPLVTGEEVTFHATAFNPNGNMTEVQSYLDGAGFFSALSQDGATFVRGIAGKFPPIIPASDNVDRSAARAGTDFTMRFPRAGRYTLWCEFGLERARLCAPFQIEVRAAPQNSAHTQPASAPNRPTATH